MSTVPPGSERDNADEFEAPAANQPEADAATASVEPEPAALVEPEPAALVEPEPAPLVEPPAPTADAGPKFTAPPAVPEAVRTAEPVDVTPAEPTYIPPATHGAPEPGASESVPVQTVYVTAPVPPRNKGNRGFGVLLAVAGAVVFTALFAAIIAVVLASTFGGVIPGNSFLLFLSSTGFLVPTVTFLVVFALAAVILNRAGWWAWVIGSFIAAVAVYFGSIGGILLLGNVVGMTPGEAAMAYSQLAVSAPVVVATILTREVIIWLGLAISARGRRVKARNVEARADYDRELAENRARYGA